jgi:hypothetical protein
VPVREVGGLGGGDGGLDEAEWNRQQGSDAAATLDGVAGRRRRIRSGRGRCVRGGGGGDARDVAAGVHVHRDVVIVVVAVARLVNLVAVGAMVRGVRTVVATAAMLVVVVAVAVTPPRLVRAQLQQPVRVRQRLHRASVALHVHPAATAAATAAAAAAAEASVDASAGISHRLAVRMTARAAQQ